MNLNAVGTIYILYLLSKDLDCTLCFHSVDGFPNSAAISVLICSSQTICKGRVENSLEIKVVGRGYI